MPEPEELPPIPPMMLTPPTAMPTFVEPPPPPPPPPQVLSMKRYKENQLSFCTELNLYKRRPNLTLYFNRFSRSHKYNEIEMTLVCKQPAPPPPPPAPVQQPPAPPPQPELKLQRPIIQVLSLTYFRLICVFCVKSLFQKLSRLVKIISLQPRLVRCFRNYRDTRPPSGEAR